MATRRRARRGETTRPGLVEAAQRIVLDEGLGALTMTRLAEDAGVTTPALYRYFEGGRDEVVLEVVRHGARYLSELIWADADGPGTTEERLRVEADRKIALMQALGPGMMRFMYAAILQRNDADLDRELDVAWDGADEFIRRLLTDGQARGTVRPDLDTEAAVQLWLAAGIGIDVLYALGRSPIAIEDVYDAFQVAMRRYVGT